MKRRDLAGLRLTWEIGNLPVDPFEPAMPIRLEAADLGPESSPESTSAPPAARDDDRTAPAPDIAIRASMAPEPLPSPAQRGGVYVLYHGVARCFLLEGSLVVWDGASTLRVAPDGKSIEARVHASSLESSFTFSSVTVTMALLLALRQHGRFHLHAAAARLPGGETWVIPGDSGCGKSTLALTLFYSGAQWVGDDVLLLRSSGSRVEAAGWARKVRVSEATATAFPRLASLLTPCPRGSASRWEIDPRRAFPGRGLLSVRLPLTLVFPSVGREGSSTIQPLGRTEALGRILHACAWVASEHLPFGQAQLDLLGRLVDGARCYEVCLGRRLLEEPSAELARIEAFTR
jgi:hypothetical protein